MTAEVDGRSSTCRTNESDARLGDVHDVNAGKLHNPTIEKQAEELANQYNGKRSFRTLASTFWCETTQERDDEFERICNVWPTAKYICYGPVETTEENKKNHCHIVIAFASSKQWKTIIKTLPCSKYHHEACRNCAAAREYALKTDPNGGREYGVPLKQGARTDLKNLIEKHNHNPEAIRNDDPSLYAKYRNGILDVCNDHDNKKTILEWFNRKKEDDKIIKKEYIPTEVHWYFGPTGCGKTRTVKEIVGQMLDDGKIDESNISIIHKMENGFAIGTLNRDTHILILDEFRGSSMKFSDLLALIDGCSINVKGGKHWIKAKTIYITSCHSPDECYPNLSYHDNIDQLKRRITIHDMSGANAREDTPHI